jgi:hypothetical protein
MDERICLVGRTTDSDFELHDYFGDWMSGASHSLVEVEVVGRLKTLTILFVFTI